MEDDEIDSWYEDEKQKSVEDYLKEIESGKDKKTSEEKYRKRIDYLIQTYNRLMTENLTIKKQSRWKNIAFNLKAKMLMRK